LSQPTPPAPERSRTRHRYRIAAGALAVIAAGSGAVALFAPGRPAGAGAGTASPAVTAPGRDGGLQFAVAGMRCGVRRVGTGDLAEAAAGEFCLVRVTVHNVGSDPQIVDGSAQQAVDTRGTRYRTDSDAEAYLDRRNAGFLDDDINPGQTVTGTLAFDVPRRTRLAWAILHQSRTTPGTRLRLPAARVGPA
jgi:hypothetical protein